MMRGCYRDAVKIAEYERGGTTFTAGVLQLDSMVFSTMQVYLTLKILPNPLYVAESLVLKTASVDYTCVEE